MASPRLDVSDRHGRRVVPVDRDPFTIGRRIGSDLHLTNGDVSRVHAEITAADGGFRLCDRGSRHGTFVNGEAVTERRLVHGDRVRLGRRDGAEFVFLSDDNATADGSPERAAVGEMRQVAVLLEGLKALSSGKVLDDVLAMVVDSAIAVGRAERGFIMLAGDDDRLEFKVGRSRDRADLPGDTFQTSRKIPEEVFRAGRTRIETDLLDGDLADRHVGTIALGIRNVLCVPLRLVRYVESKETASEDRRIGVLYLDSRTKGALLAPETGATLDALAAEAAVAIDNARLYRAAVEKARLDQEMATAAEIQRALLPTRSRNGPYFDAAAEMLPCLSIGGDFFEYIDDLPAGRFGFALGDVSGKGPPAALLGALTQGSLAAQTAVASGPADALARLNSALVRRAIEGRYVTLFYAQLDPDGTLTFCNGGHNPPFLVRGGGEVRRLETGGMPMGLFDGLPFFEESVAMEPGDFLVLFSDGVSEALDPDGAEFEDRRILESIAGAPAREAPVQLEHLLSNVKQFTAGAPQNDDVTVVVVAYRGRAPASAAAGK